MTALQTTVDPLVRVNTVLLREYVGRQIAAYGPDHPVTARELVNTTLKDLYYQPTSDGLWERGKARIVNWTLRQLGGDMLEVVFEKIIVAKADSVVEKLKDRAQSDAGKLGVDVLRKVLLDADRKVDLSALDRTLPQIILDAAGNQIRATFQRAYLMIALAWLAIAALLAAEMLLYSRWYEKRRQPAPDLV